VDESGSLDLIAMDRISFQGALAHQTSRRPPISFNLHSFPIFIQIVHLLLVSFVQIGDFLLSCLIKVVYFAPPLSFSLPN
jgi:hypothetical protein